jgi:hypothetical protein
MPAAAAGLQCLLRARTLAPAGIDRAGRTPGPKPRPWPRDTRECKGVKECPRVQRSVPINSWPHPWPRDTPRVPRPAVRPAERIVKTNRASNLNGQSVAFGKKTDSDADRQTDSDAYQTRESRPTRTPTAASPQGGESADRWLDCHHHSPGTGGSRLHHDSTYAAEPPPRTRPATTADSPGEPGSRAAPGRLAARAMARKPSGPCQKGLAGRALPEGRCREGLAGRALPVGPCRKGLAGRALPVGPCR